MEKEADDVKEEKDGVENESDNSEDERGSVAVGKRWGEELVNHGAGLTRRERRDVWGQGGGRYP